MSNEAKPTQKQPALSRRTFFQVSAATVGSTVIAACGGTTSAPQPKITPLGTTIAGPEATATIAAAIGKTYFPSGNPDIPDAFTAPLPPYQSVLNIPGTGGKITGFSMIYTPLPTPLAQNKYWQQLNKTLNIDWEPGFATSDAYAEKASVLVASNNPPDLFVIWPESVPALYTAISQGAFLDLTSQLTGSALQKYPNLARISPKVWKNSRIGGKLYGVPRARPLVGQALFVRADWLQQVGITTPRDENEFFTLMSEISKGKLNKGQQTWGLGALGGQIGTNGDVSPWIFSMFSVPNNYRLESNGSLTYFLNTQEFLDAIAYLRKLYQAGIFYPDALVMTITKAKTNIASGKIAAYWDGINAIASANGLQAQVQATNPKGEIGMLVPPGVNGSKGSFWLGQGNFARTAIPSAVTDQGKVDELLRLLDFFAAPAFSVESNFLQYGIDGRDNIVAANGLRKLTTLGQSEVYGLPYLMNGPYVFYTPDNPSLAVKQQQYTSAVYPVGVSDATLGLYSPTATKQSTVLNQLYKDRFLRIVTGADPVSSAKNMYSDWLSNGGTQILQEYTSAMQKSS